MNDFPETFTNNAPAADETTSQPSAPSQSGFQQGPGQATQHDAPEPQAFLEPLKRDIDAQVGKLDTRLQQLRDSISDVQRQIAELEGQRSTLLQMQRLADGKPVGSGRTRAVGAESSSGGRQRLSPDERRKQIVDLIASSADGMKKAQIIEATGLSKIYVQNLLTEMRNAGKLQSQPSQSGDGSLVWRVT